MSIIPFPAGPDRPVRSPPPEPGRAAAILFFTGVRIERHDEVPPPTTRPKTGTAQRSATRRRPARKG